MTDVLTTAALFGSGLGAGVMNALAGGGTILTFPTMHFLGIDAIRANATSTVALVPGAAASLWVHRREVGGEREWARTLLLPSVVGGAAGSALLLLTPASAFRALSPWLVLFATLLFLLQIVTARRGVVFGAGWAPRRRLVAAVAWQFAVAVYGGYFGAGIGILMLAMLGFIGLTDMHAMNGLKNLLGMSVNAVACVVFIAAGIVDWPVALTAMAGAALGGFAGAKLSRWIGREKARWAVVVVGLVVTGLMLFPELVVGLVMSVLMLIRG